ncbi:hypothetical protein Fcan01_14595 [Folsomia candida]|uniref:Uncharacterized protein n=1 Tax=Folsomia candida TaxID=158441 RepID=A0A226DZ86_FOLCA|nr:hypothetical protein Fcan01_14595 [Folsomia candida]
MFVNKVQPPRPKFPPTNFLQPPTNYNYITLALLYAKGKLVCEVLNKMAAGCIPSSTNSWRKSGKWRKLGKDNGNSFLVEWGLAIDDIIDCYYESENERDVSPLPSPTTYFKLSRPELPFTDSPVGGH